jgi:hypothetical protein
MVNIWLKRWRQWMNKQNNNEIVPSFELVSARRPTLGELVTVENIKIHEK